MRSNLLSRISILFLLLSLPLISNAFQGKRSRVTLSDGSRISLLTCSKGDELYSVFGHSAIRVTDQRHNLDIVFNYGTFNFNEPGFYPNFIRGRLKYILSAYPFKDFKNEYVHEKRWIYEQILNVNLPERQYLFDSLLINLRPENRYYPYDFFNDNCATRIRDIFVQAIPRDITFDYSSFDKGRSFRKLLEPNLRQSPWAKLGIDLLLGLPADKATTPWQYMYLPDHLLAAFEHASFASDSTKLPFAQPPTVILKGESATDKFIWGTPFQLFLMILVVAGYFSFRDFRIGVKTLWFDRTLLVSVGLLGVLFTFLWVGTAHKSMVWNFNLLWAIPFHLIMAFFISMKRSRKWVDTYLRTSLIVLILVLILWPFMPQTLPWAIYPLVLALALRIFVITRFHKVE